MSSVEKQEELGRKNVIVTGWPLKEEISFTESGIRKVAGTPSSQISINGKYYQFLLPIIKLLNFCLADYSIEPSDMDCNPTVVSGHVRDLWNNRHPSGKILNALDLPLYAGDTEPTDYASELHAWDVTRGHHHIDQKSSYPTEDMRWALVGLQNALTFLHLDCEGVNTEITVADGKKAWGFLYERISNPLSSIDFFLKDSFRLNEVLPLSDYDLEIVALRPGDKL